MNGRSSVPTSSLPPQSARIAGQRVPAAVSSRTASLRAAGTAARLQTADRVMHRMITSVLCLCRGMPKTLRLEPHYARLVLSGTGAGASDGED